MDRKMGRASFGYPLPGHFQAGRINQKEENGMPTKTINERTILEELRQIPEEHWGEILTFLRSLQPAKQPPTAGPPILAGADLVGSDLIGMWADRTDIKDGREFARQLRHQAEHRRGTTDAAGH